MKAVFVLLLAASSAIAIAVNTEENEETPRDKRHLVVLVPPPQQMLSYVPVMKADPYVPCGMPSFMCQGACNSNSVGGIPGVKGEYPWLAQVYSGDNFICSGSIIDRHFILTSASCIEPSSPASVAALRVRVGDFKRSTHEDGYYTERNVTTIYRHTDFIPQRKNPAVHDIALLKLTVPLTFTDYIKPVCLDEGSTRVDNGFTEGIFSGYGKLAYSTTPATDVMHKVNVRINTPQECQNTYSVNGIQLLNTQICAGTSAVPSVDPCVGDNGGPLVIKVGPNSYKQVGVASFGLKCGGPPAVFTRVSAYRAWIEQVRGQKVMYYNSPVPV